MFQIKTTKNNQNSGSQKKKFKTRFSPIGLDLGSGMTKAIQFRQEHGELTVHKMAIEKTPKGLVENGMVNNVDKLAGFLSQIRLEYKWKSKVVNLCLNPQAFYMAKTRVPAMANNNLKKALQLEAENKFPLSPGEFVYSFCPLYSSSGTCSRIENDYILVAAEKKVSLAYSRAAALAGFKTTAIDIEPFALMRKPPPFSHSGIGNDPGCSLVINLGFQSSTVLITDEMYFSYCRSIRFGIENFVNALSSSVSTDSSMASKLLFSRDALKFEPVQKAANQMVTRLKQTIDYWQEQDNSQGQLFGSLQFCGGGALIPGLPSLIGSNLGIKPALYNPVMSLSAVEIISAKQQTMHKALFATACGLALRGWLR
jgi:type IV pilus assembly protein PilM